MLILFAGNDTRIENISHNNVVQFCRNEQNSVITCQPSLANQANSVNIVDIDQDGSQELISFTSSFVQNSEESTPEDWRLVTYVRLLRLQPTDLSNFYKSKGFLRINGGDVDGFIKKIDLKTNGQNNNYNTVFTTKTTNKKNKNFDKDQTDHP